MPVNYLFIADFFTDQIPNGGAEIANSVIIEGLIKLGHNVSTINSHNVHSGIIEDFQGKIIVGNFLGLSDHCIEALKSKDYIIYEHDFKMLRARCPLQYQDLKAPDSEIINKEFYEKARKVILQSQRHRDVVYQNLKLDNLVSAPCNPWREEDLKLLEVLSKNKKTHGPAVLVYGVQQKNTIGAINYCLQNGIDCNILHTKPHGDFLLELSKHSTLVFFPLVFETFSRVAFEARCLGLELLANENISFLHEDSAKLKGLELIDFARKSNKKILDLFTE